MKRLGLILLLAAMPATAFAGETFRLRSDMIDGSAQQGGSAKDDSKADAMGKIAADAAADPNYQKVCDAYGEGYVYGSDGVCVKVGGFVRFGTSGGNGR